MVGVYQNESKHMQKQYRIIDGPASVQGSAEWHAFRKGKIGASDAASIMGISPWESKLQCWERIQFDVRKSANSAMKRGTEMEEKARTWMNSMMPKGQEYKPVVLQSIAHPDIIASLDGYFEDDEGKPHIAEIKCPGVHAHGDALAGRVPEYYIPQLNHQMDLAGVNSMLYISFDGNRGVILTVQKDEEYCQKLFVEELAFLASLIDFKPPPASDRDWLQVTDSIASEKAERYKELSMLIDELETEREEIRDELKCGDDHPRVKIGDLKIQRFMRRGTIEYDKIPELQNVDLEPYRKKSISTWRFSV